VRQKIGAGFQSAKFILVAQIALFAARDRDFWARDKNRRRIPERPIYFDGANCLIQGA
jgi:hypothetical protein